MYKDKNKQRVAAKKRQKRYRDRQKGVPAKALLSQEDFVATIDAIEQSDPPALMPKNFGQPNCECRHCRNNRLAGVKAVLNHGQYKIDSDASPEEVEEVKGLMKKSLERTKC